MKLVRDNIPRLHAKGALSPRPDVNRERQMFRRAEPGEYGLLLRLKLAEEVGEVLSAASRAERLTELGDLLDVVFALMTAEGWSKKDHERRDAKAQHFGGFSQGWVLEEKDGD